MAVRWLTCTCVGDASPHNHPHRAVGLSWGHAGGGSSGWALPGQAVTSGITWIRGRVGILLRAGTGLKLRCCYRTCSTLCADCAPPSPTVLLLLGSAPSFPFPTLPLSYCQGYL